MKKELNKNDLKLYISRDKGNSNIYNVEWWDIYLYSNIEKTKVNFGELSLDKNCNSWDSQKYFFGDRLNYGSKRFINFKEVKEYFFELYIEYLKRMKGYNIK